MTKTILYRLPNQKIITEAQITERSPCGKYIKTSRNHWIEEENILSYLEPKKKKRRTSL